MVLKRGAASADHSKMSAMILSAGSGGKIHACWAWYSLRMSFWIVPRTRSSGTPWFSAVTRRKAYSMSAGPLIVIDTETLSSGMPSKSVSMSARLEIATPHFPTSPSERRSSESYPMRVGKSKATESPVCPRRRRYL